MGWRPACQTSVVTIPAGGALTHSQDVLRRGPAFNQSGKSAEASFCRSSWCLCVYVCVLVAMVVVVWRLWHGWPSVGDPRQHCRCGLCSSRWKAGEWPQRLWAACGCSSFWNLECAAPKNNGARGCSASAKRRAVGAVEAQQSMAADALTTHSAFFSSSGRPSANRQPQHQHQPAKELCHGWIGTAKRAAAPHGGTLIRAGSGRELRCSGQRSTARRQTSPGRARLTSMHPVLDPKFTARARYGPRWPSEAIHHLQPHARFPHSSSTHVSRRFVSMPSDDDAALDSIRDKVHACGWILSPSASGSKR